MQGRRYDFSYKSAAQQGTACLLASDLLLKFKLQMQSVIGESNWEGVLSKIWCELTTQGPLHKF